MRAAARAPGATIGCDSTMIPLARWKYAVAAVAFAGLGVYSRLPAPPPRQPIAFPHSLHVQAGVTCLECHRDAAESPAAGLPSVAECALCHSRIQAQVPVVQQVLGYARRGEEIPWRPVYGFPASAHIRFRHDMHVKGGIACATCHGDVGRETTARVWKPFTMGTCLKCHRQHGAGTDCERCHD
jgi:hypothetical protein